MRARRVAWALALVTGATAAGCFYPDYAFDLPDDAGQAGAAGSGGNGGEAGTHADASDGAGGDAHADQSVEGDAPSEAAQPDVSADQSGDEGVDATPDAADETSMTEGGDEQAADAADGSDAGEEEAGGADAESDADAMLDTGAPDVADAASEPDAPGAEDCTNHKDDNGDGLVDCADPQCGAFTCVAPAPALWSGPFALYDGLPSNPVPACPAHFDPATAVDANGGLIPQPAQCSACTCSSPSGATCPAANPTFWDNSSACKSGCYWSNPSPPPPNACLTLSGFDTTNCSSGPAGVSVPAPVATGGACLASTQSPTLPPYTWGEVARVCAPKSSGGGCSGSNVCAPVPSGQYQPKLCIVSQAGVLNCPSGPYTVKHALYQSAADSRSCSACTCGTPAGVACGGTLTLYSDTSCMIALASFPNATTCGTFTPAALQAMKYVPGTPTGGGCTPSGGQPTGTVSPNQGMTVCCMP